MSTELPGGTDAVGFWGQHPEQQVSDYVIQPQDPIQVASMVIKWAATNGCHIGHHLSCCSPWCERMRKLQASCPYKSFLSPPVAREFISANIDGETFMQHYKKEPIVKLVLCLLRDQLLREILQLVFNSQMEGQRWFSFPLRTRNNISAWLYKFTVRH